MQPKLKLLKVLDILKGTDQTHPITAVGICKKLEEEGIAAERKSVCRDIRTLVQYGYRITLHHDNKLGYYIEGVQKEEPIQKKKKRTAEDNGVTVLIEYKEVDRESVEDAFSAKGSEADGYFCIEATLGKEELFGILFTLGQRARISEPAEIKEDFEERLSELLDFYKKPKDNKKIEVWLL